MKDFTPIAMRCTTEQFKSIKQVLIDNDFNTSIVPDYRNEYPFLYLNTKGELLRAGYKLKGVDFKQKFCAETFLKHCGINIQPKDPVFIERYNITDKVKELLKECKGQGFELNIDNGVIILKQI